MTVTSGLGKFLIEMAGLRRGAAAGCQGFYAHDFDALRQRQRKHIVGPQFGVRLFGGKAVDADGAFFDQGRSNRPGFTKAGKKQEFVQALPGLVLSVGRHSERSSFLKKRLSAGGTKKLSVLRALAPASQPPTGIKVFLLLFIHKKKTFLPAI
jgi:hypothetical protein